jgi:F-type H+-transporting ATPase subunit epsilon
MKVRILTPQKQLLDVPNASELFFPGELGIIEVLDEHAPLVTNIGIGVVICTSGNISHFIKVSGGVAEVSNTTAVLLVDVGEEASDIDLDRAKRALEKAEARLASKELGNIDVKRAQEARDKAQARIEAVELKNKQKSK